MRRRVLIAHRAVRGARDRPPVLHDDRADIEIAPGTTVTVALGAVGGLAPETTGPDLTKTDNEARATQTSTDPEES